MEFQIILLFLCGFASGIIITVGLQLVLRVRSEKRFKKNEIDLKGF